MAILLAISSSAAREKNKGEYGAGLIVNVPFPESEVTQVVRDVTENGIIRGTKEYNKDQYITGAQVAASSPVFSQWTEGGKVFYKVRYKAVDPRNFKDSSDVGTLAVRYIVQSQDETHTVLRIDARFVEDFRHMSHPSNGSVEGAEYQDIHNRLDQIELMKTEAAQATKAASNKVTPEVKTQTAPPAAEQPAPETISAQAPVKDQAASPTVAPASTSESMQQQIHDLRRQVQRKVKAPGAPMKTAPFHTAANLQLLPAGTDVLIEIATPYWLGVETHDGQHGWMLRDDLEQIP